MSNNNETGNNETNTTAVAEAGTTVSVHYRGSLDDGTEFDNSYDRGEALNFTVGAGQMIRGFDNAVLGMQVGETKTVRVESKDAYGPVNPQAIKDIPRDLFPEDFVFQAGATVHGHDENQRPVAGVIIEEKDNAVTMDFNHPMAGFDLNFEIELVEVTTTSDEDNN